MKITVSKWSLVFAFSSCAWYKGITIFNHSHHSEGVSIETRKVQRKKVSIASHDEVSRSLN